MSGCAALTRPTPLLAVFVVPEAEDEALLLQELVDLLAGEADLAADVGGGEQGYPRYGYPFRFHQAFCSKPAIWRF